MSLKTFHLIFVTALSSLCFGCGVLELHNYAVTHASKALSFGVCSLMLGVVVVVYGKYFLKKLKKFSYL